MLFDELVWVFCFYVTYFSTVFQSYLQDCLDVAGSAMPIKKNKPVLLKFLEFCSSLIGYEIVPETSKCSLGQHFFIN